MDYKKLLEEIRVFLSDCERVRYGELVGAPWPYNQDGPMVYTEPEDILLDQAAAAIIELLARAEAAEARAEKAEHDMKRIVNRSSYPCEYCTKEKCFATDMKRQCYDFTWDSGQKEE